MRRTLLTSAAVAVAMAMALSACGSGGGTDGDVTLTWASTGGQESDREKAAFQDPFTDESGIEVENVEYTNLVAQLKTMVESGKPVWDVINNASHIAAKYCGTLLEKVDYSDFPDVFPEGTTTECTRPAGKYGFVFAYDVEAYKDKVPTSIADFFDTGTFPGKRVIRSNNPRAYVEAALVADGVDPKQLYPLDVDRALAKLGTIKNDLILVPSVSAVQQNLVDKEATMTITINTNLGAIKDSGATIAPVWDVTFWDFNVFMIPKGTPKLTEAVAAVKSNLQPEQLTRWAELGGNVPARTDVDVDAIQFTSGREFSPFLAERGDQVLMDAQWWADNLEKVSDAWVAWQAG